MTQFSFELQKEIDWKLTAAVRELVFIPKHNQFIPKHNQ